MGGCGQSRLERRKISRLHPAARITGDRETASDLRPSGEQVIDGADAVPDHVLRQAGPVRMHCKPALVCSGVRFRRRPAQLGIEILRAFALPRRIEGQHEIASLASEIQPRW